MGQMVLPLSCKMTPEEVQPPGDLVLAWGVLVLKMALPLILTPIGIITRMKDQIRM